MKHFRLIVPIACLVAFLFGCGESGSEFARDFPQIVSSGVEAITKTGVTISATLDESMLDKIDDSGVVWGQSPTLEVDKNFTIHQGKPASPSFEGKLLSQLLVGKTYYARVYIKSGDKIIYGTELSFVSLGSEGPIIESVSPTVVSFGDLVTVKGRNFGTDPKLKVAFRALAGGYGAYAEIKSIDDNQMVVVFPKLFISALRFVITKEENQSVTSTAIVRPLLPELSDLVVNDLCSEIKITGERLSELSAPTAVYVNDRLVTATITNNSITLNRSNHARTLKVEVQYQGGAYTTKRTFTDSSPYPEVSGNLPAEMPISPTFVLDGKNLPTCGDIIVSAYNVQTQFYESDLLQVTGLTSTQITMKTTREICSPLKIYVTYRGDVLYTSDPILPRSVNIESITPDHGTIGTEVTINGSNLKDVAFYLALTPDIYSSSVPLQITSNYDTEVKAKILSADLTNMDPFPVATMPLIGYKCQTVDQGVPFTLEIEPLTITDYSPKTGDGSIPLTITGSNFLKDPGLRVGLAYGTDFYDLLFYTTTDTQLTTALWPNVITPPGQYKVVLIYFGQWYEFPQTLFWDF